MRLIKKILLLFILSLLLSCNSSSNRDTCGSAWIGGEIVNPKTDHVILSHNRNIIDTIPLDGRNFFKYQLEQVDPGIYFFSHFEYQALHIEPGDSLMFRVNTIEFDESLTYTGKGAEKNNFLMELFLSNEDMDNRLPALYSLTPSEFELKMDSLLQERLDYLNVFKTKHNVSKSFESIAKAAINYSIYSKKEKYISANSKMQIYDKNIQIPESFYAFRENIDLGSEALRNYYPYYRYLGYYLDNLAFEQYKHNESFDHRSFSHNKAKIELIDSLITNDSLRNSLIRTSVAAYLLYGDNAEEEAEMLAAFRKLNNSSFDNREITRLAEATMRLAPGNVIPNVMLLTTDNTVKDLHSVIKRPTVLYFWSSQSIKHYRTIHTRASELRNKFPEFDFVGVNVDGHYKKWRRIVNNAGYNSQFEYQFDNFDDAEMKLLVNNVNKAMILNRSSVIMDGNSNIFGLNIEQELLGLINQ